MNSVAVAVEGRYLNERILRAAAMARGISLFFFFFFFINDSTSIRPIIYMIGFGFGTIWTCFAQWESVEPASHARTNEVDVSFALAPRTSCETGSDRIPNDCRSACGVLDASFWTVVKIFSIRG